MLNKLEKAFFEAATGRIIFICLFLSGGIANALFHGNFITTFPNGAVLGVGIWAALAYCLARRRQRNASKQRRLHV